MNTLSGIELSRILSELASQEAYDHPVRNLRVIQTHASCVFLTGRYAYKIKKPVNFDFLDYSTPDQRFKYCQREVLLNRRLSPDIYIDVVPIVDLKGHLHVGGKGNPVEWAVRMRQLPESDMLHERLKSDSVSTALMERIAQLLASFHANAETNREILNFGTPERIRKNVMENFAQTSRFIGDVLTSQHYLNIKSYSEEFLNENCWLFLQRVQNYRIRDGHGDLRAQNIGLFPHIQNGIQILDCIEFNDRFRFGDVASDLAYLAMDLDLSGRADLRKVLVDAYARFSSDVDLPLILPFYLCYRAYIRGKIALFASVETEIPGQQRREHEGLASAAFDLANSYALRESRPTLFITTGVSGSGKSVLALELARRLPAIHLSSDKIRKQLAGASPFLPLESSWYRSEQIAQIYDELRNRAKSFLQKGENVILDATFLSANERDAAAAIAASCGVPIVILECRCAESVARERIYFRNQFQHGHSDATIPVLEEQLNQYEPVRECAIRLDTEAAPHELARQALRQWRQSK